MFYLNKKTMNYNDLNKNKQKKGNTFSGSSPLIESRMYFPEIISFPSVFHTF